MRKICFLIIMTFIFAVAVFVYGLWFVYDKTINSMGILSVLVILFCCLYVYCSKKITYPEGYTLIQAFLFYRKCEKYGVNPSDRSQNNLEIMQRFAKEKGVSDKLNADTLRKMYYCGKEVQFFITPQKKTQKKHN